METVSARPGRPTCCLPIFSPTVTTIRFHPTIVPSPSAMSIAALAQLGMNLVAWSICFLNFSMARGLAAENATTLVFSVC
jgi:hypothetical protein